MLTHANQPMRQRYNSYESIQEKWKIVLYTGLDNCNYVHWGDANTITVQESTMNER